MTISMAIIMMMYDVWLGGWVAVGQSWAPVMVRLGFSDDMFPFRLEDFLAVS